jgi:hypothetical protein
LPFLQVQQSCALPTMCTAFVFPVALEATPVVSLRAVNPNGTTSRCVALEHTPSLDPPTPYVAMRFGFDSALVRAGTDVFPPALSPVESCERFESPALVLQVRSEPRSAPLMYFFRHVDGPLWLQRQGIASEPFPP